MTTLPILPPLLSPGASVHPMTRTPLSSTKRMALKGAEPQEWVRGAGVPFVSQSFLSCVGCFSAICEGPDACKKDEVCVKPGLCRCKPGFFGAQCSSREFQWSGEVVGQKWLRGRK